MPDRRVLLLIVDGLTWNVVEKAVRRGRLRFFAQLADRGVMRPCSSIFPSITPAATASLVTGASPRQHGVQGAFWYDRARNDVEYFGDSLRVILREGFSDFVDDYLRSLNDDLLQTPTLFELADERGWKSACVNLMWRRGGQRHPVDAPLLMKLLPGVKVDGEIAGPDWLCLGEFVDVDLPGAERVKFPTGPQRRFGFNDDATLAQLRRISKSEVDPDLTVAYFPDNDFDSHDLGPDEAVATLEKLDHALAEHADRFGGVDAWLEQTAIVVVGDHGHDDLAPDPAEREIKLDELLSDYQQTPAGASWRDGDELMVCPNMRAAQVCFREGPPEHWDALLEKLFADERVDQAIYRADDSAEKFVVCKAGARPLTFWQATPDDRDAVTDPRGDRWMFEGDLASVGASVGPQSRLVYGDYPDALRRIYDGSPSRQGSLWLTAKPGHEFVVAGTTAHQRGSHGSLHRSDSESVLIAAGLPDSASIADYPSITDVAGLCLATIGDDAQVVA